MPSRILRNPRVVATLMNQALVFLTLCCVLFLPISSSVQSTEVPSVFGYHPVLRSDQSDLPKYDSEGRVVYLSNTTYTLNLYVGGWPKNVTCVRVVENAVSCESGSGQYKADLPVTTPPWFDDHNCSVRNASEREDGVCADIDHVKTITISFSEFGLGRNALFYFCVPAPAAGGLCNITQFLVHQGTYPWLTLSVEYLKVETTIEFPLPVRIILIVILLMLSGLFSGLNLGLMSLDLTSLKIVMESGTKKQKWCAKKIYPVRKHGNYLLCTILFSNVAVNSTITVLMGDITSGPVAVVMSTIGIVIFGEIIPQAICSRFGLYIGAGTIWLTYICMVITFPVSFPLSFILNRILGQELGASYNRNELLQLLKITKGKTDIKDEEVDIIFGALCLKEKSVQDVMTKLSNVYCLDIDRVLNFDTIQEIYESGHSRIPIYEGSKHNIVGLLYTRNLAFLDPEDEMTLRQYHTFYQHQPLEEWPEIKLDVMLERFVNERRHLAVVKYVNNDDLDKDPFYEVKGIITLEDIIEEILQREIVDESDRYVNNEMLEPAVEKQKTTVQIRDIVGGNSVPSFLSSSQKLAIFQVLSASIEPFKDEYISPVILKKVVQMKEVSRQIMYNELNPYVLYQSGEETNFFTLIVEGSAHVTVGSENMTFDCRSFSHFGTQALMNVLSCELHPEPYVPDFTVRLTADCLLFTVTQKQYSLAYQSSRMARTASSSESADRDKDVNVELLGSSDDVDEAFVDFHRGWKELEQDEGEASESVSWSKRLRNKVRKSPKSEQQVPLLLSSTEEGTCEEGQDDGVTPV